MLPVGVQNDGRSPRSSTSHLDSRSQGSACGALLLTGGVLISAEVPLPRRIGLRSSEKGQFETFEVSGDVKQNYLRTYFTFVYRFDRVARLGGTGCR